MSKVEIGHHICLLLVAWQKMITLYLQSLGQLSRSDRLPSLEDSQMGDSILGSIQSSSNHDMSDTLSWNYRTSSHEGLSDEAYGSDKSGSGDDQSRGRQESWESRSFKSGKRSKSSDVRAGKFLNKLRGQKFSGLKPEHFHTSKKSIRESGTKMIL